MILIFKVSMRGFQVAQFVFVLFELILVIELCELLACVLELVVVNLDKSKFLE